MACSAGALSSGRLQLGTGSEQTGRELQLPHLQNRVSTATISSDTAAKGLAHTAPRTLAGSLPYFIHQGLETSE